MKPGPAETLNQPPDITSKSFYQPLVLALGGEKGQWSRRLVQATWVFVFLGLVIRIVRYLLRFPLWPDESFLAASFINSTFGDLLGAIDYHQVAPLLFLWTELIFVKLFGFTEYTLRLFPFLCGLGSVFLFFHLARRLFKGAPLLLAVAIFAVAYYPVRHGAEVKPYVVDLAVSLLLLTLAVEWLRDPARNSRLWGLGLAVPFAIGLSFPAVFVTGGISIGLFGFVLTQKNRRVIISYCAVNLVLVGSFLAVYALSTGPQYQTENWLSSEPSDEAALIQPHQQGAWLKTFPPLHRPAKLAGWFLSTHTGRMFAYPNGGTNGSSAVTFICFVTGAVVLYRKRRRTVLSIFLAPFGLAFVAAALHRYPYGYSARFNLYLAPIICLLAGLGAARLIAFIRPDKTKSAIFIGFAVLLALAGIGLIFSDLVHPYKNKEDVYSRCFARWFWPHKGHDAEIVCVYTDLHQDFSPRLFRWGNSARYLCHQRIYSPFHQNGPHRPDWEAVSRSHPLRCVVFSIPETLFPFATRDEELWHQWMAQMKTRYELAGHEKHEVNSGYKGQHETYEIYEFVPRPDRPRIPVSGSPASLPP